MSNIVWSCPNCQKTEKTSPRVTEVYHGHGELIALIPFKKPRKPAGEVTLKSLKAEVWDIFSEWVRRSAADENGYCQCVTCGKRDIWQNMQAGHYLSRRYNAIFLDERNVNVQCPLCNGFGHGMESAYKAFIIKKYGENVEVTLQYLKDKHHKFTEYELINYKNHYLKKLKEM